MASAARSGGEGAAATSESKLWYAATPSNSLLVTWVNGLLDRNTPTNHVPRRSSGPVTLTVSPSGWTPVRDRLRSVSHWAWATDAM